MKNVLLVLLFLSGQIVEGCAVMPDISKSAQGVENIQPGEVHLSLVSTVGATLGSENTSIITSDDALNLGLASIFNKHGIKSIRLIGDNSGSVDNVFTLVFPENADTKKIAEELGKLPNVRYASPSVKTRLYNFDR